MTNNIIECNSVDYYYNSDYKILDNFNLMVATGEKVAILGKSGTGKSTLLNLLAGLDNTKSGSITVNNYKLDTLSETKKSLFRQQNIGFIYQFHYLLPDFNILDNIAMPLLIKKGNNKAYDKAKQLLVNLDLTYLTNKKPNQLSGGESQRVAIARAIITKPPCIFADEPTGNIDNYNAQKIIKMLLELNKNYNTTIVLVTHDKDIARQMDYTIYL